MPRLRARTAALRDYRGSLTFEQVFELLVGPLGYHGRRDDAFPTDRDRRAAWSAHRERLMLRERRPWAYWEFEGPAELRGRHDDELGYRRITWLAEHGHLTEQEISNLTRADRAERANEHDQRQAAAVRDGLKAAERHQNGG